MCPREKIDDEKERKKLFINDVNVSIALKC